MIRRATKQDFVRKIVSESELRVCALKQAYGLDVSFVQFFADDRGSIAALMDGFLSFYCVGELTDEWCAFLLMHSDIHILHTDAMTATAFARKNGFPLTYGSVYKLERLSSGAPLPFNYAELVPYREIYALLAAFFDRISAFEPWYVDISHRIRHDCCHIATEYANDRIISIAMTVAETEEIALIGGVATVQEYRGKGAASRCIGQLISNLSQSTIFIAPDNDRAAQLYKTLGFTRCGTWAEVSLL